MNEISWLMCPLNFFTSIPRNIYWFNLDKYSLAEETGYWDTQHKGTETISQNRCGPYRWKTLQKEFNTWEFAYCCRSIISNLLKIGIPQPKNVAMKFKLLRTFSMNMYVDCRVLERSTKYFRCTFMIWDNTIHLLRSAYGNILNVLLSTHYQYLDSQHTTVVWCQAKILVKIFPPPANSELWFCNNYLIWIQN